MEGEPFVPCARTAACNAESPGGVVSPASGGTTLLGRTRPGRSSQAFRREHFLRLNPNSRMFAAAGALSLTGIAALPHTSVGAESDTPIQITSRRLHVVSGERAAIRGVLPRGQNRTAQLERRTGGGRDV